MMGMDTAETTLKSVLNAAIAVQALLLTILGSAMLLNVGNTGLAIVSPLVLILFIAACALWAVLIVRDHPSMVWMAPVAYLGGSAMFFGFGPLVNYLGNETTRLYLSGRVFPSTPADLAEAHLLSLAAIGLVLIGQRMALAMPMGGLARLGGSGDGKKFSPEAVAIALLALGFTFKFGIDYPAQWGWYTLPVPSTLAMLKQFIAVGLGILAFIATRRGGAWIFIFWFLWLIDTGFGALEFSKQVFALNALLPLIGYFAASRNLRKSLVLASFGFLLYLMAAPYVFYARTVVLNSDGTMSAMSFEDRADVLTDYVTGNTATVSTATSRDDLQAWWTRLDFTGKQAFVIDLKSQGIPSPSMTDIGTRLVPRVLWPDKPIIVGAGREFYRLATGRDVQNFASVSLYADIYWHGGISALLIFCPLLGMVLIVMMRLTRPTIVSLNYAYFPAVLLGIVFAVSDLMKYADSVLTRIVFFALFFVVMRIILMVASGTERAGYRTPATQGHWPG